MNDAKTKTREKTKEQKPVPKRLEKVIRGLAEQYGVGPEEARGIARQSMDALMRRGKPKNRIWRVGEISKELISGEYTREDVLEILDEKERPVLTCILNGNGSTQREIMKSVDILHPTEVSRRLVNLEQKLLWEYFVHNKTGNGQAEE